MAEPPDVRRRGGGARVRSASQRSRGRHENAPSSIERAKEARKAHWSSGRSQKTRGGAIQAFHFCGTNCGTTFIIHCFFLDIFGRRRCPYVVDRVRGATNDMDPNSRRPYEPAANKGCTERPDIRWYLTHMPLFDPSRACQPGGPSTYGTSRRPEVRAIEDARPLAQQPSCTSLPTPATGARAKLSQGCSAVSGCCTGNSDHGACTPSRKGRPR